MTKLYDLCVATRHYKDTSGNDKAVWENIGSILKNEDGKTFMMLKAHFNPAAIQRKDGSESILVSMFPPKNKNASSLQDLANSIADEVSSYQQDFSPDSYDPNIPF